MSTLSKNQKNFKKNENIIISEGKISFDERITKSDISDCEKFIKVLQVINPIFLDYYDILECIGSGSESVVFKVYHKQSKQILTMKVIIRENDKKGNINEYIISNKLKNNNIIKIYKIHEIKKKIVS